MSLPLWPIRQRWFHTFRPCAEPLGDGHEGMWARFGSQGSIALNWHSRYNGTRYSGTWLYLVNFSGLVSLVNKTVYKTEPIFHRSRARQIVVIFNTSLTLQHDIPSPKVVLSLSFISLQWRHNECDGISKNWRLHCLLNCSFRHRLKKRSKLCVTGLCAGGIHQWLVNSPHKMPVKPKIFSFDDVFMCKAFLSRIPDL